MSDTSAILLAIDIMGSPSRLQKHKQNDIPEGMDLLLRIVVGDIEASNYAIKVTERNISEIRRAAEFFIIHVLFQPGSHSYRILGVSTVADTSEIRRNMAYLSRWLHPDSEVAQGYEAYWYKITEAWETVKTSERRAAYDKFLQQTAVTTERKRRPRPMLAASLKSRFPEPKFKKKHRRSHRTSASLWTKLLNVFRNL